MLSEDAYKNKRQRKCLWGGEEKNEHTETGILY